MRDYIFEQLCKSELKKETGGDQNFYILKPNKTIFAVNLNKLKDEEAVRIVYGWHYLYNVEEAERDLEQSGICECKIRFAADIYNMDDWKNTTRSIKDKYEQYENFTKEELITESKELRKQFIKRIAVKLKPLGFKKKNCWWNVRIRDNWELKFNAQKSYFSDEYYFNIYIKVDGRCENAYGSCFYGRVFPTEEGIYDWQLTSPELFDEFMDKTIRERLLPIMQMEPKELGKLRWIQKNCHCDRKICEDCWVEKNLWECKETSEDAQIY